MAAFRPVFGCLLLAGGWWASSAFVPSVFTSSSSSTAGNAAALRGASVGSVGAGDRESGASFGVMAPLGIAMLGLVAMSRQQRSPSVSRRFFGGSSTPPAPKQPKSYKDYSDPWLGDKDFGFLGNADFGFDPLNVAVGSVFDKGTAVVPETTYYNYRESEVKHGRFAMAAFLAIFFEGVDREALFQQMGVSGAVDNLDATLGLDELQAPVLLIGLGAQALAEYSKQRKENDGSFLSVEYNKDRCPGDLGFDPLGISEGLGQQQLARLHNAEVNVGRLAMIGITSFLFNEFLIKDPEIASRIL